MDLDRKNKKIPEQIEAKYHLKDNGGLRDTTAPNGDRGSS